MSTATAQRPISPATWFGLVLAFLGAPGLIFVFNQVVGNGPLNDTLVLIRETGIFALTALLLLVVIKGEKLGLDSAQAPLANHL